MRNFIILIIQENVQFQYLLTLNIIKTSYSQISSYCYSIIGQQSLRFCRCGAGTEKTPGKADTPGFEIQTEDTIEEQHFNGLRILSLRRNERRMKQTSMSQLQSWRANCDVSVLIYDHDPADIQCTDIANVSGYVVSYCTKGNLSYKQEAESLKTLIMAADDSFAEGTQMNTITLARKILNTYNSKRIISKAEVSCDLLNLPLYKCTESFKKVSLSTYTHIRRKKSNYIQNELTRYANRDTLYASWSFEEYFYKILNDNDNDNTILYCYGLNGTPCFPVSYGYAKSTLIRHKPWSIHRRLDFETQNGSHEISIQKEFDEFILSEECPKHVSLTFHIAKENNRRRMQMRDCHTQNDPETTGDGIDEDTAQLLDAVKHYAQHPKMAAMDKGLNYNWNETRYKDIDPTFTEGINWLRDTVDKYRKEHGARKRIPKKKDGTPYKLEDIENDKDQSTLVYAVLNKIHEWVHWPKMHQSDQEKVSFNLFHCTISINIDFEHHTLTYIIQRHHSNHYTLQYKELVAQERVQLFIFWYHFLKTFSTKTQKLLLQLLQLVLHHSMLMVLQFIHNLLSTVITPTNRCHKRLSTDSKNNSSSLLC